MVEYLILFAKAVFILLIALVIMPVLIYVERKGSSFIQDRTGPNRAAIGPFRLAGLVHVLADVTKLLTKEMMIPPHVNRVYFIVAPFIGFTVIVGAFAVIPWADTFHVAGREIPMLVADLNGGILYILAITSLHVYGMVFAGWASNNKFALMGGLRSSAQMISYELPLGLAMVGIFMVFQSVHLNTIVQGQGELLWGWLPRWGVVVQPLGFILFTIAAFAEANRTPFDLPEGESEIVAGYHVEYSGIRFAMFYMGEYVAIVLSSCMITTLFFGGWQVPWLTTQQLVDNADLLLKIMLGAGGLGALTFAVWMFIYGQRIKGNFGGSIKEKEGDVLGVINLVVAAVMFAAFFRTFGLDLPEWGARTVTLVVQITMFVLKVCFWCWVFIWVRWSLPRFRYDQLMSLGWKKMIPLSFVNIVLTALVILLIDRAGG